MNYRHLAFNIYGMKRICELCSNEKNICVHHIDENHLNNSKENFQILCTSCHVTHHNTGKTKNRSTKNKISTSLKGNTCAKGHTLSIHSKNLISIKMKGSIPPNRKYTINGKGMTEWCKENGKSKKVFYRLAK